MSIISSARPFHEMSYLISEYMQVFKRKKKKKNKRKKWRLIIFSRILEGKNLRK